MSDRAPLPRSATQRLAGWGRHPVEECTVYRPERRSDIRAIIERAPENDLTPRGLGRSYGDASLNSTGAVVLSQRLDRILGFDAETAELHCEASVSLSDILERFLPQGFFFPVTPGTEFITIGGAIAADVHGKNHHGSGSMAAWLLDFRLLAADGQVLDCSRDSNPEVFWATVGGMGLTGMILDARIRLQPVATAHMRTEHEQLRDLDALLERTSETDSDSAYSVAWIDCLSRGRQLGRSVVLRANHADPEDLPASLRTVPLALAKRRTPRVPFTLPNFVLSRPAMRAFNEVYFRSHPTRTFVSDCRSYFYPLDSIRDWNRAYGRRGVLQYQCLFPTANARSGLVQVLETLAHSGSGAFLSVLKSMGPASGGLLSFPYPGQTLALDLPFTGAGARKLVAQLDAIVLQHGGRVYLAKDACLSPESFRDMYPDADRFREIRDRVDPRRRFSSALARRVGLVESA